MSNPFERLDAWERLKAHVAENAPMLAPQLAERREEAWANVSTAEAELLALMIVVRRDPANPAHRRQCRAQLQRLRGEAAPAAAGDEPSTPRTLPRTLAWIRDNPPARWLGTVSGPQVAVATVHANAPALADLRAHHWLAAIGYPAAVPDLARQRTLWRLGWLRRAEQSPEGRARALGVMEELAHGVAARLGEVDLVLGAFSGALGVPASGAARCLAKPMCTTCPLADCCDHHLSGGSVQEASRHLHDVLRPQERPREKLLASGTATLSDAELLAILLNTGTAHENAVELARRVLDKAGSLSRLGAFGLAELTAFPGIGPAKATTIRAALELARRYQASANHSDDDPITGARTVFDRFRGRFAGAEQEEFVVLLLNNKNRVIRDVRASLGTLNSAPVHPRECFKEAIRESAAAVIFLHNHPSGDPAPSRQDDVVTKRLREAGEIVGIPVLDHIIIGRESFFSYADAGRL